MSVDKKGFCLLFIKLLFVECWAERDYFAGESSTVESDAEYLDPHSFYYDKHTHKEVLPVDNDKIGKFIGSDDNNGQCDSFCNEQLHLCRISLRNRPTNTDIADEILSRRFVNMLLSRTKFKQEGLLFTGFVELEAMDSELRALKEFGQGKLGLREVDAILNKVMKTPEYDRFFQSAIWIHDFSLWMWSLILYSGIYLMDYKEIVASIIFTLYIIRSLRKMRYNSWMVLSFGTVIILVMSFFITWWKLIQEAEIKHTSMQMQNLKMPVHCQPERMTWWDKFTTVFASKADCEKYYEAVMKTPFLQVTPVQALSHMISHALMEPIAVSGKTIANFLNHLTADMSWFMAAFVRIVICVSFLPLMICCLILAVGGSLNFGGFGPLSFLSLKGPSRSSARCNESVESKLERRPIEVMLNINLQSQGAGMIAATPSVESNQVALTDNPEKEKRKSEKKTKKKAIESRPKKIENGAHGANEVIKENGSGDYKVTNTLELDDDTSELEDESSDTEEKIAKRRVKENSDQSK